MGLDAEFADNLEQTEAEMETDASGVIDTESMTAAELAVENVPPADEAGGKETDE